MKQLYLIRHAKSSWTEPGLDDFQRPLNKRGKKDGPLMAARLYQGGIRPDLIAASPAKRARKTAEFMAEGTGYAKEKIRYYDGLYLGSPGFYLQVIAELLARVDVLFVVGHNNTITELGQFLTGKALGNVPTCGIVGIGYPERDGFSAIEGGGKLLLFEFPKNQGGGGDGP